MWFRIIRVVVVFCVAVAACVEAAEAPSLGSYVIQKNRIFVAGISSGGAMAAQLDIAYSGTFKGAAIYAGIPYYCAKDNPFKALSCAINVTPKYLTGLEKITQSWAQKGLIDPLQNIHNDPIYLWSGRLDNNVHQAVVNQLESYYRDLGADVFQYDKDFAAGHGWESPSGPVPCGLTQNPYIIRCNDSSGQLYDSEQVWLARFFGPLQPKNQGSLSGTLLPFNQGKFAPGGAAGKISMADNGYVFVPQSCANGTVCGLMLALHGCEQGYSVISKTFISDAGINQWADTNNIIVLYPQAIASLTNPLGCWDWWGYLDDPHYAQRRGPQMKALFKMVERVSAGSGPPA